MSSFNCSRSFEDNIWPLSLNWPLPWDAVIWGPWPIPVCCWELFLLKPGMRERISCFVVWRRLADWHDSRFLSSLNSYLEDNINKRSQTKTKKVWSAAIVICKLIYFQPSYLSSYACHVPGTSDITNLNTGIYCRCLNLYLHKLSKSKSITFDSVLTETEYTCLNCRWLYSESHSIPLMSFLLTRYIQFVIPFETLPKTGYILFNFQQIVLIHPIQLSVLLKLMNVATHQAPHDVLYNIVIYMKDFCWTILILQILYSLRRLNSTSHKN